MRRSERNKKIVITTLLLSIFLFFLFKNITISSASDNNNSLMIHSKFQILEFSDQKGTQNNISSIDIELPSSTWNITYIEMNFTNIEYHKREIKNVENISSMYDLFLSKHGLEEFSVQINLNDTITIYGVYLNIKTSVTHPSDEMYIQIGGYNSSINAPNSTVYRQVDLNYTIVDGWNYQNFTSPITLPKGNYSLIMGGVIQAAGKYYWYYNNLTPNNPNLYRSENNGSGWINGIQGSPFLYKIDQKIKQSNVYPEKFNMTAKINGIPYKVLNNTQKGSGTLKLLGINFSPNDEIFHIPIKSNKFFFNLSYHLKLKNQFLSNGFAYISEQEDNIWKITPNINRCNYNYSVKIELPSNWYNLTVFKDTIDITASEDIMINNNVIYILNNTINNDDNWEITAKSPKINFILDLSRGSEFELGNELLFSVIAPIRQGNFTVKLYNELGAELDNKTIPIISDEIIYSFNITSTASPGNWIAYIYWNNNTDAGVQSQIFSIISPQPLDPDPNPDPPQDPEEDPDPIRVNSKIPWEIILIILASVAVGSLTVYQTIKRKKGKNVLKHKKISNKFKDILSLNCLMISDIKSGVNVYEQFFMGKFMDPSLISGFLDAIKNFGIELTGSYRNSETLSLDYEDSIILMNESNDFRIIIVMSEKPSEEFTTSITNVAKDIQEKYGDLLQKFKGGEVTQFAGISELIEMHLNVSFASPLQIVISKKAKPNALEKSVIDKANAIMKQTNLNYFYTSFLMPDQKFDPEMTKVIFNLIKKKIFQPISLNFEE